MVAIASYSLAQRATASQLDQRFASIRRAIEQTNFPLSRNVLLTLRELTSAHWVTLNSAGEVMDGTVWPTTRPATADERARWQTLLVTVRTSTTAGTQDDDPITLRVDSTVYRAKRFNMSGSARRSGEVSPREGVVHDVVVLFDDVQWRDMRLRSVAAPLVTGLSTIMLLSSVTLFLTGRLVGRLKRLQREVDAIAMGNFSSRLVAGPDDEIGRLGRAVESMAGQLRQMWDALGRHHGQRLLHQVAGGLAHNLRNSLTGARMAVELHARDLAQSQAHTVATATGDKHPDPDSRLDEGLRIAIEQIEQAEDYVRRLLLVSKGKQDIDRPSTVGECLAGVSGSLDNSARHLGVGLGWHIEEDAAAQRVADGPTLTSAVTNLVWNAIQAGQEVRVDVRMESSAAGARDLLSITVTDNGPGPAEEVATTLFEPLVTTKPEGLGLGLPLVKRAAETLGGNVQWQRRDGHTHFFLVIPIT
jgi:signal transduction histidine kinase